MFVLIILYTQQPPHPGYHFSWHRLHIKLDKSISNLRSIIPCFHISEQIDGQKNNLFVLPHCVAKLLLASPRNYYSALLVLPLEKQIIPRTLMSNKLTEKINSQRLPVDKEIK